MKKIEDLMKHSFFKYFKEISDIPRESGNEKEISDYLVKFAKERNLDVIQDKYLNVIIKKNATKGYEHIPGVILQGHMDMVCVKNIDSKHDFTKDPIKLKVVDNMIYADGTTLGSDDGVALAYALAILDCDKLNHPALEIVMTTEEESTMMGAMNIDSDSLNGKIMINLDSNRDDELLVSSTGGVITTLTLDIDWTKIDENYKSYEIFVSGLIGGHSGEEIHKERGNANKILGRILDNINSKFDIYIQYINAGSSSNAISREAQVYLYINKDDIESVEKLVKDIEKDIKDEFKAVEKELTITTNKVNVDTNIVLSKKNTSSVIDLLLLIPNGVQSMSMSVEGLVESSNNIGTIRMNKEIIEIESEIRSCIKSKRYEIESRIKKISELLGFSYSTRDAYPEWNYNDKSIIQQVFKNSYKELFNENIKIQAVHAGLETGIFLDKIPYLDIISYGPNAYELHNPCEHMNIPSCIKVWDLLIKVLENTIKYY